MSMNNILKEQDIANYQRLAQNWETRRAEEEQSLHNVDRWRQEVYAMRIENIKILKTSKSLSQKLAKDSKKQQSHSHHDHSEHFGESDSVSSGSLFAPSEEYLWSGSGTGDKHANFATSMNSSSVVNMIISGLSFCHFISNTFSEVVTALSVLILFGPNLFICCYFHHSRSQYLLILKIELKMLRGACYTFLFLRNGA